MWKKTNYKLNFTGSRKFRRKIANRLSIASTTISTLATVGQNKLTGEHNNHCSFFPTSLKPFFVGTLGNHSIWQHLQDDFCQFIESTRTPTGRAASIKFYLQPSIRTLVPTRQTSRQLSKGYTNLHASFIDWLKVSKNIDKGNLKKPSSIKHQFNAIYDFNYIDSCAENTPKVSTVYNWFVKLYADDTAVHPHKSAYCNTCYDLHQLLTSAQQKKSLLMQVALLLCYNIFICFTSFTSYALFAIFAQQGLFTTMSHS